MALTTSLVAYFKLDEASGTRYDSHSTNDLTDVNTVGSATGKIGNAADFDATASERFTHAGNDDLRPFTSDFTIAGWAWLDATGGYPSIVASYATFLGYDLFVSDATTLTWRTGNNNATEHEINVTFPGTGAWFYFEAWREVGVSTGIRINNGSPVTGSDPGGNTSDYQNPDVTIGARNSGAGFLDGKIDELGFWHRLLTSGERAELYNGGAGLAYPFIAGVVIPIRMNQYRRRRCG